MDKKEIISNVNRFALDELLSVIEREDSKLDFLDKSKELIIIERNPNYLHYFVNSLLSQIGINDYFVKKINNVPSLPHHHVDRMGEKYNLDNLGMNGLMKEFLARVKSPDSAFEKLTRYYGEEEKIRFDSNNSQLFVGDFYGLKIVSEAEEDCRDLSDKISNIKTMDLMKIHDHMANPPSSGYRALHHTYAWNNGVPRLNGIAFEVHYVTEHDRVNNEQGTNKNLGRSHRSYNLSKLKRKHSRGNYEVVIVEHDLQISELDNFKDLEFNCQRIYLPSDIVKKDENEPLCYHFLKSK